MNKFFEHIIEQLKVPSLPVMRGALLSVRLIRFNVRIHVETVEFSLNVIEIQ